ncbi:hypothetical protein LEP1GSC165_2110 [Leptospira santarosai str. CBC523]|nr:hypothetical protein LEP1GSC165_2110 [Leptospira santarosai str. CBC523]
MESYVLKAPGVFEAAVAAKPDDEIRGEVPVVLWSQRKVKKWIKNRFSKSSKKTSRTGNCPTTTT